jgi:hypothetical protein
MWNLVEAVWRRYRPDLDRLEEDVESGVTGHLFLQAQLAGTPPPTKEAGEGYSLRAKG